MTRACLVALLLFVAGRCLVPMDETDLYFNLRLGEIILGDHTVPRTNLLSFTFPDVRDVNLAWLFQIVLALVHRAGGIPATLLLKTAFVLATVAALFRVAVRRGAHPAAAAAALALSAWAAEPRFVERPYLVTFLGLACTLLAVERAEDDRPRALYALIPCGLVWANANSCFFLAPVVLALYALGARADKRPIAGRRAALCALALAPLILATPSGVHALGYIANHWRMPVLRPLDEYRTARWPLDGPFFFVAAGVLAGAALPSRRIRHLVPVVALGLLGARRIRFVAEFALLAGPIVACAVTDAAAWLFVRLPAAARAMTPRLTTIALAAALASAALVPRAAAVRHGGRFFDLGVQDDLVPLAAIQFADDSGLRHRMYNDMEVGSYLTWQGWPRYRVFQDPRINGYPASFHAQMRRDDLSRAEWQALLDGFGVDAALLTFPGQNPRAAYFDPARWALVYRAADGLVFAARTPAFAPLIARAELPVTFSFDRDDGWVRPRLLAQRPTASPVAECEWSRRAGDFLVERRDDAGAVARYRAARAAPDCLDGVARIAAGMALGDAALRLHDPATAADAYGGIDLPGAHRNRALALLALDRPREALDEARAAVAGDPTDTDAQAAARVAEERLRRGSR